MNAPEDALPDAGSLVFVYGTLQPGGLYWPSHCQGRVRSVRPARVRGRLYDLHVGYPGLRLEDDGWVEGCLLEVPDPVDFARIDQLEGYDPARPEGENEYIRRRVACFDASGEPLGTAWTYEVSESELVRRSGAWIESGVWPLKASGAPMR